MTAAADPKKGPGGSRPGAGRPPIKMTEVVARVPDGQGGSREVSRLDRVREVYRVCGFDKDAAARCGVNTDTYRGWLRDGNRLRADLLAGRIKARDLKVGDKERILLAETVEQAEVEGRLLMLGLAEQLSRGGIKVTHTTIKEVGGQPTERTVREEQTLPDGQMIRWRLERRYPAEFGVRRVELTGEGGGPLQVEQPAVGQLLETLDRMAQALAPPSTNGHAPAETPA